jgi:murein DD-endopeptidase MepM/ murein hydrolase activator NlpD
MRSRLLCAGLMLVFGSESRAAGPPEPTRTPILRVVDLDTGESAQVRLSDGKTATVKLLGVEETRDAIRNAVRRARVKLEVNGQPVTLSAGNYNLPTTVAGVQIDCSITSGCLSNSTQNAWGLAKTARFRLWPEGSPWIELGTFVYPVKQRWFASGTQMANEPCYVDGEELAKNTRVYYHNALDIGGAEGMTDVVAAAAGLVVVAGKEGLPGYEKTPARPRYDQVYVLDDRGWLYRYCHLMSIDEAVKPGSTVKLGQKIGVLGKEGDSGGWSHLHFEVASVQPSGKWGTQEGYAFLWEAYQRQYSPKVTAVARPHHFIWTGQSVVLDGSKSRCQSGQIARYDWTLTDGSSATGAKVERSYSRAGRYSEILKVTDTQGNADYDFAVVQVLDREHPDPAPPAIQAAFSPTMGVQANDPITFKVRTFNTTDGEETWDFGDGSPLVKVKSLATASPQGIYGNMLAKDGFAVTEHRYSKPGDYLVRVERVDSRGAKGIAHLHVVVGDGH